MSSILFATTNPGKLHEASAVAAAHGVVLYGLERITPERPAPPPAVSETEGTYEANAIRKARVYATWSGVPTIADDTGLEVPMLGDLPGVYTARFGVERVLHMMGDCRLCEAVFVCCLAYGEPQGRIVTVTKRLRGYVRNKRGARTPTGPLPLSEFFIPCGETRSLAELVSAGNYRSHRGLALGALFAALLP